LQAKDTEIAQLKESVAKLQGQLNTGLSEARALRKERDDAKADAAVARKDGASSADDLSKRLNQVCLLCPYPAALLSEFFFQALSDSQSRHAQELRDAAAKSAAIEKWQRSVINRLTSEGQSSMQAVNLEKEKFETAMSSNTALRSEVDGLKQQREQLQSDLAKVSKERDDLSANVADVGADAELRTLLEVGEYIASIQELTSQVGLLRTHLATARQELLAASNLPQPNDDAAHVARMLAFLRCRYPAQLKNAASSL
jgi:DNA repair exonuclease SbcCD ATPase subunit